MHVVRCAALCLCATVIDALTAECLLQLLSEAVTIFQAESMRLIARTGILHQRHEARRGLEFER